MAAVVVVVLVLVGGAAWVGRRLRSYPGGWACAFDRAYAADRRSLAGARRAVRALEQEARQEISGARAQVRREEERYRSRIAALEGALRRLRDPGRGEHLATLGGLTLHRHVLRFPDGEQMPLARLRVRFEPGREKSYIYVTRPNGKVRPAVFAEPPHEEDDIRLFAVRIQNAVADEDDFQGQREGRIARTEDELERARADTAAQEAAREQVAQVAARRREDHRLDTAQAKLDAARRHWHQVTGHWPR